MSTIKDSYKWQLIFSCLQDTDLEAVHRFISNGIANKPVAEEDAYEAAVVLFAVMEGFKSDYTTTQLREALGISKQRKLSNVVFRPADAVIGTMAWNIVVWLVREKITPDESVNLFRRYVKKGCHERTIKRWIAEIRPRVELSLRMLDEALAEKERGMTKKP
jgi:hypothetical protein